MSEHFSHTNPKPFLRELVNHPIVVTLKFNKTQYKGNLVSTDNYFNLQLSDAEEVIDGKSKGKVGEIFIRCNNVLWIGEDLTKVEKPTVAETEGANAENISSAQ
ncbi:SMX3 (YPR182W) [Zygosaccharomyces parabailii]|nr:SMX3 (YPR182W) [Zygosaccharomyces parabailii]